MIVSLPAWAQERAWEGQWELHPLWWPFLALAAAVVLLVLFGWALLNLAPAILGIVGAVLGIRWLMKATGTRRSDPAVAILRERYARGEIGKEEFEAKMRDLGGTA
jgi:putative membrane protein